MILYSYKKGLAFLFFVVASFFSLNSHALPFTIGVKSGTILPTNVISGHVATAYYTIKNNTQIARNNNFLLSLPANVTQVTSGGTYSDTCSSTLNFTAAGQAGDQCTLQLAITAPVNTSPPKTTFLVCFPGGRTCSGTGDFLNVTQVLEVALSSILITPATTPILYPATTDQYTAIGTYTDNSTADLTTEVSWNSSNPAVASISTTGLATGNSIGSTNIEAFSLGITSNTSALQVISTPIITATLSAAGASTNSTITINFSQTGIGTNQVSATLPAGLSFSGATTCTVTQSTPACSLIINTGTTANVTYTITPTLLSGPGSITSSPATLTVNVLAPFFSYVSDYTSALYQCPINPATGDFSDICTPLTNATPFTSVSGVTFNTSNASYAYIGDATTNLWQCPLNSDGTFSATCTALISGISPSFTSTRNTTFQTFNTTDTYAYVSDNSSGLWRCPINATGGFSGSCNQLTNTPAFQEVYSSTFNTFNGNVYAYVSDHNIAVWKCLMDSTGSFLGNCALLGNGAGPFTSTLSSTFKTFNGTTYLYIADNSTAIWKCPINTTDGTFSAPCIQMTNNGDFYRTTSVNFITLSGIDYAYVTDASSSVWQCTVDSSTGNFSNFCTSLENIPSFNADILGLTFYTP